MTPFSAFATTHWEYGPESLVRYNGSAAYEIQGENASGFSSGVAMTKMETLAIICPPVLPGPGAACHCRRNSPAARP
jgi:multidrug efflux pump